MVRNKEVKAINADELRNYLKRQLPDHMIPSFFVRLKTIPLTLNGKVDKNRLPKPDSNSVYLGSEYVPPQTEGEKMLAKIWCDVLKLDRISIHDNFFSLGGDSILAIKLMNELNKKLNINIVNIPIIFNNNTVSKLAQYLMHNTKKGKKYEF